MDSTAVILVTTAAMFALNCALVSATVTVLAGIFCYHANKQAGYLTAAVLEQAEELGVHRARMQLRRSMVDGECDGPRGQMGFITVSEGNTADDEC